MNRRFFSCSVQAPKGQTLKVTTAQRSGKPIPRPQVCIDRQVTWGQKRWWGGGQSRKEQRGLSTEAVTKGRRSLGSLVFIVPKHPPAVNLWWVVLSGSTPKLFKILSRLNQLCLRSQIFLQVIFKKNEEHTIISKNTKKQDCKGSRTRELGRVSWG